MAPWPVATSTFSTPGNGPRIGESSALVGRRPTRTSPRVAVARPGHDAQRFAHDLADPARGRVGREADVFDRRADRDAVIGPRHHVVAVHLLHDRPTPRVVLGDTDVRDLTPVRDDRQDATPSCSDICGVHTPPTITAVGALISSPSTTIVTCVPARTSSTDPRAPRRRDRPRRAATRRTSRGRRRRRGMVQRADHGSEHGNHPCARSGVISVAPVARSATHSHADRSVSRVANWRIPQRDQPQSGPTCVRSSS